MHGRPPYNRLRYSILSYKSGSGASSVPAGEWNDIRSEISSKLQAGFQGALSVRQLVAIAQNVQHVEFCTEGFRQSRSTRNEIPRLGTCTDTHCDLFGNGPVCPKLLALNVVI